MTAQPQTGGKEGSQQAGEEEEWGGSHSGALPFSASEGDSGHVTMGVLAYFQTPTSKNTAGHGQGLDGRGVSQVLHVSCWLYRQAVRGAPARPWDPGP